MVDVKARVAQRLTELGGRSAGRHMTWLAAQMGVSRVALHGWVSGRVAWPVERKAQLAGVLGVDQAQFFKEG